MGTDINIPQVIHNPQTIHDSIPTLVESIVFDLFLFLLTNATMELFWCLAVVVLTLRVRLECEMIACQFEEIQFRFFSLFFVDQFTL